MRTLNPYRVLVNSAQGTWLLIGPYTDAFSLSPFFFYPYPCKVFSGLAFTELLPVRKLKPAHESAVEVGEGAQLTCGLEHTYGYGFAKAAAESAVCAIDRHYIREASFAHLARKATEKQSQTNEGMDTRPCRDIAPLGEQIHPDLRNERKEWQAGSVNFFLDTRRSGSYLKWIEKTQMGSC